MLLSETNGNNRKRIIEEQRIINSRMICIIDSPNISISIRFRRLVERLSPHNVARERALERLALEFATAEDEDLKID